ncbi:hypothetical protein E7T06_11330 [Deinococcus sp. Arct2-2]|uniref:hypothetical protein n=1 Tax=Deinococcus sp. Arct2-2 TaxID=2568653 RepID=UPI0010A47269|nr:hypothetical protein [Deinococcus sp. Arct2-2]THF69600.1 hypothetical protein E7T06_11330 [Deinococcus sp. Arct2-2]
MLHAGRVAKAQVMAAHALGHRVASRQLDQQARQNVGRDFRSEIFSVCESLDNAAERGSFRQRSFRLILVWRGDGTRLIVANTRELEILTGMDVGEEGWNDLAA